MINYEVEPFFFCTFTEYIAPFAPVPTITTGTGGIGIFDIDKQGTMGVRFSFTFGKALVGTSYRLAEIGIFSPRGSLIANLSNFADLGNLVGMHESDGKHAVMALS